MIYKYIVALSIIMKKLESLNITFTSCISGAPVETPSWGVRPEDGTGVVPADISAPHEDDPSSKKVFFVSIKNKRIL